MLMELNWREDRLQFADSLFTGVKVKKTPNLKDFFLYGTCLPVGLSACLSVCLSVCVSVCQSVCLCESLRLST